MNVEIDISSLILKTERLVLRPWKESDAEDLYEYARVDGVGQMAGWLPHKSIEESREIIRRFIDHKRTFAVELDGKAIGSLGIEEYSEVKYPEFKTLRCREIGYVLSRDYWGRGIMPEAVKEVIRYLFEDVGLDVIFCGHFLWNTQSLRVQEKCGFRHYDFGEYETAFGKIEPHETRILTREDWFSQR
ncbi:MAG: GNAT family N-acetyltransferase [Oscillospiraceae bacterium]|nr:GNAT family N-acetyltransferase [Oscillospiraceae bacterium]